MAKTDILWTVADDEKAGIPTISKLLEQINDVVPLESTDWGLEDYVVSINGFECLHFSRVDEVLKDEDEVVYVKTLLAKSHSITDRVLTVLRVRPLTTSEVRARTRSGRTQISDNGQHLVDGVPYGRSYTKRSKDRPIVNIPSRKDTIDADTDVTRQDKDQSRASATVALDQQVDEDSEENDEDYMPDDGKDSNDYEPDSEDDGRDHYMEALFPPESEDDDSTDSDSSDESDEDESESESSSEDDSEESEDEAPEEEPTVPAKRKRGDVKPTNGKQLNASSSKKEVSPSESSTSSTTKRKKTIRFNKVVEVNASDHQLLAGSSDDESEEDEDSSNLQMALAREETPEPESRKTKKRKAEENNKIQDEEPPKKVTKQSQATVTEKSDVVKASAPPGEGRPETQQRNLRRRKKNKLVKLIAQGVLASNASYEDMHVYLEQIKGEDEAANDQQTKTLQSASLGQVKGLSTNKESSATNGSSVLGTKETLADVQAIQTAINDTTGSTTDSPATRRTRLDLASSRRLLFGSLGVRAPKTKEDEATLREKFANPPKVGPHIGSQYTPRPKAIENGVKDGGDQAQADDGTGTEASPESDAWRAKIKLSAIECIDEGVQLSEPPYPFLQCWDEQYAHRPKNKKRKRRSTDDFCPETEDSNISLDYDDPKLPIANEDDPEFPPLPSNMSTIPAFQLDRDDLNQYVGALIAFKQLQVSAATQWAPQVSNWKSARIDSCDKKHLSFILAPRNRDVRANDEEAYDEKGRRLLSKFEMPDEDAEATDDGYRDHVAWDELIELKLLESRSTNGAAGDADMENGVDLPDQDATVIETEKPKSDLPNGGSNELSSTINGIVASSHIEASA